MSDNILILDCDGVIFDSIPLIDEYVKNIKYEASDAYKKELDSKELKARLMLNKFEEERSNNPSEYGLLKKTIRDIERKRKEHYEHKDCVLEEALKEYKDRINYKAIYQLENTFDGVINMIYTIYGKSLFKDIYILSHVNSQNEIIAKTDFFKKYLPMVKFIPVYFHVENFFNSDGTKNLKRIRTNKIGYFKNYTGIDDLSKAFFADDTESIINEARNLGVVYTYYKTDAISMVDLLRRISFDAICSVDNLNKVR